MANPQAVTRFTDSEVGMFILQSLQSMEQDNRYNTTSSYSANITAHPDNLIPFAQKHMQYLSAHPKLDPTQYLSNLRLMTRIK